MIPMTSMKSNLGGHCCFTCITSEGCCSFCILREPERSDDIWAEADRELAEAEREIRSRL
jgi:hypothetical protein